MQGFKLISQKGKELDHEAVKEYLRLKYKTFENEDIAKLFNYLENQLREISKSTLDEKIVESLIRSFILSYNDGKAISRPLTGLVLSSNSITVLKKRYLKRDEKGRLIETPEQMFRRVADSIAEYDHEKGPDRLAEIKEKFYNMMAGLDFLPNSPTLMNAGTPLQQLSACFVLPVKDSMEDIFEAIKNAALIHKSGGGTGFSFSRIRPANDTVLSTKGVSSGPISFMKVFNSATETIKQGGRRRGANMAILRVDHPDIIDFINCKKDTNELNNFNISVAVTESFMEAVEFDDSYELVNPRDKRVFGELKARKVFDLIVNNAYETGEPGVIFIDRINRDNATPFMGEIESTNPCGEQPLLPYESCNLGSINLCNMLKKDSLSDRRLDWEYLKETVYLAVRFLDNVIDANKYPLKKIRETTLSNRKIGLGIMGFADLLFYLDIPYNSEKALILGGRIMKYIKENAVAASQWLASIRGAFPNWEKSILRETYEKPLRNSTLTTIAPTGTLSIIANCSSGIEPLFSLAYERNVMDNTRLKELHSYFYETSKNAGFYKDTMVSDILKSGSIQDLDYIPEEIRKVFVTALDISPKWHTKMQAAFQKWTDNAVSKTVNFPENSTKNDVRDVFQMAYKYGCKGITIYRQNSRPEQVLQLNTKDDPKAEGRRTLSPRLRPDITYGRTARMRTGCGNLYITINEDDEGLSEVFIRMGKSGGCLSSYTESIGRLVSLALRSGIGIQSIIKQLNGIRCPSPSYAKHGIIHSCADAIRQALADYLDNGENGRGQRMCDNAENNGIKDDQKNIQGHFELDVLSIGLSPECPECSSILVAESNCLYCRNCGYSKCP